MKKIIKRISVGLVTVFALVLTASAMVNPPALAAAGDGCKANSGISGAVNPNCALGNGQTSKLTGNGGVLTTVINTMLFIVGLLSVVMIIYSGIRYVTAHGDKSQVESAKNTLMYAIVGLVISIVAYAVVSWVTNTLGSTNNA